MLVGFRGRNEQLLDIVCNYPNDVMKGAGVLTFCPGFVKRYVVLIGIASGYVTHPRMLV